MILPDLADFQGTIVRAFAKDGFFKARYFFFAVTEHAAGRAFVDAVRGRVTSAESWGAVGGKPKVAVSIGFSYNGLEALHVPARSLGGVPDQMIVRLQKRPHLPCRAPH